MLSVQLFGPPQASLDSKPLRVDTRKAIALLAYLAVEKAASRDHLAGLLWAEASQERARATLRRTLSALRSAGAADLIAAGRELITLSDHVASDVAQLETEMAATSEHGHQASDVCTLCIPHLRRVAELYRGEFLQGFSVRDAPEFEEWVRAVGEGARIRVGGALHRLGTALAAEGQYPEAIAVVNRWLELDLLHEPAHRFLMLLHAWAGDRAGAIEAYRRCVAVLDEELGVAPLEETTELYEAILDEDLPPAPGAPRRVRAETRRLEAAPDGLIDRASALDAFRAELAAAAGGEGRVVALVGSAWMGKTRLIEEFAEMARRAGHTTIVGRCFRGEQALPHGMGAQLLRGVLSSGGPEPPAWARAELGRVLPELGSLSGEEPPDPFGQLRLLEAFTTVLLPRSKGNALVMLVDDLQWADSPSAAMLSYLSHRIAGSPILLVVSARPDEDPVPEAAELIGAVSNRITLEPLQAADLAGYGVDAAVAQDIVTATGGVPLLVADALRGGDAEAGVGVTRYIAMRLQEVSDLGRQLLTAAAVLGRVCDPALLRATSGRSEEEVVDGVEELMAAGLIRETPEAEGLGITLDALEKQVYESTSLVRRRLLHRRAGRALAERSMAREDPSLAAEVAGHLGLAGDADAGDWYLIAAGLARKVYANESAVRFYEEALAAVAGDGVAARLGLAELAMAAGEYETARRHLSLAAAIERNGLVEHRRGEVERLLGHFDLAEDHYGQALASGAPAAEVLADWALLAHRTGRVHEATDLAARARATAEEAGASWLLSRAHDILAVVTSDPGEALGHAERAIELAGDDELALMAGLNNKALLLGEAGAVDEAIPLLEEAIGIAARTGHRHREAALWNHLADLHHRAGREEASRDALTRSVSLFAGIDRGDPKPELWLLTRW